MTCLPMMQSRNWDRHHLRTMISARDCCGAPFTNDGHACGRVTSTMASHRVSATHHLLSGAKKSGTSPCKAGAAANQNGCPEWDHELAGTLDSLRRFSAQCVLAVNRCWPTNPADFGQRRRGHRLYLRASPHLGGHSPAPNIFGIHRRRASTIPVRRRPCQPASLSC